MNAAHLTPDADGTDEDLAADARVCDLSRVAPQVDTVTRAREDISDDLRILGLHVAARCVLDGLRHYADTIVREVGDAPKPGAETRWVTTRALLSAQVAAWGRGDDAKVIASNEALTRESCCACALVALATGDAMSACAMCRAEGGS